MIFAIVNHYLYDNQAHSFQIVITIMQKNDLIFTVMYYITL